MSINPDSFDPIDPELEAWIIQAVRNAPFPSHIGLVKETVKRDYARMRLPYRPELNQPAGIIHGGAIASLIDTAVVGAVFSGYAVGEIPKKIVTIDMHIHYIGAGVECDLICHAAVRRRGRRVVFLETDVVDSNKKLVAHGELSYMILG